MKKLSILLVVSILLSLFSVNAFAEESTSLYAEISDINNGEIVVSVYGDDLKSLVSLNLQLKYDTDVFYYKEAYAALYDETAEDEIYNFSGMWMFGKLSDGSGCAGVLVSTNGSTRNGRTKICEFVLGVTGKRVSSTEITLNVKELVTEDYNYLNDIYTETAVEAKSFSVDYGDLFGYTVSNGISKITECYYSRAYVDIPENIGGGTVEALSVAEGISCPFVIIPESVSKIERGTLSSETVIICPKESDAEVYAEQNSMEYFTYINSVLNPDEFTLVTEKTLIFDIEKLIGGTAEYTATPSDSYKAKYYGTESKVEIINGENTLTVTLCVIGDLNGDSVVDVLDCALCERAVNERLDLNIYQEISSDLNADGEITVNDYSAMINKAIS